MHYKRNTECSNVATIVPYSFQSKEYNTVTI
jgi:hypothetical protein